MIQKQFFPVFQLFAPEVKHFHQKHTWMQGRIQPVSLGGGAIWGLFGSQVFLRVHCCRTDEVCFTRQLWQNNGRQNGLVSRMLFSEL